MSQNNEPFCWIDEYDILIIKSKANGGVVEYKKHPAPNKIAVFDHTAPVRQPLSDEDISDVFDAMPDGAMGFLKTWGYRQFARAIEAKMMQK